MLMEVSLPKAFKVPVQGIKIKKLYHDHHSTTQQAPKRVFQPLRSHATSGLIPDWVRAVAWSPVLPALLASGGEDQQVGALLDACERTLPFSNPPAQAPSSTLATAHRAPLVR